MARNSLLGPNDSLLGLNVLRFASWPKCFESYFVLNVGSLVLGHPWRMLCI